MLEQHKHHDTLHFPMVLGLAFVLLGLPAYMHVPTAEAQACPAGFVCTPVSSSGSQTGAPSSGMTYSNGYYYSSNGYTVPSQNYYGSQSAPSASPSSPYNYTYPTYVNPYSNSTYNPYGSNTQSQQPQYAPLSVSCSGAPSGSSVSWSAAASGGTGPYRYSWSMYGDPTAYPGGSSSSASVTATYASAGVKQAYVAIYDSRGISTYATCSATAASQQTAANSNTTNTNTSSAYICGGSIPTGAGIVRGSNTYSYGSGTAQWTFVANTAPAACQWTCISGYGYDGSGCSAPGTYTSVNLSSRVCEGTAPMTNQYTTKGYGSYTPGYGTSQWTYVSSSPSACQYTCVNGGVSNGSGCTAPQTTEQSAQSGTNGIGWTYYPGAVRVGTQFTFNVVNTGTKVWGSSHDLGLSSANLATNYQFVNLGTTQPNGYKTVTFTAPMTPGTYVLRAVEQNVAWFGQNQTITVTP